MTVHGQLHVDAAKADGRWAAAYPSSRTVELPADFLAACSKKRAAEKALLTLGKAPTASRPTKAKASAKGVAKPRKRVS
jgi:uncharacterized protein YdeI (YjbR/CyaY-like superfamily)